MKLHCDLWRCNCFCAALEVQLQAYLLLVLKTFASIQGRRCDSHYYICCVFMMLQVFCGNASLPSWDREVPPGQSSESTSTCAAGVSFLFIFACDFDSRQIPSRMKFHESDCQERCFRKKHIEIHWSHWNTLLRLAQAHAGHGYMSSCHPRLRPRKGGPTPVQQCWLGDTPGSSYTALRKGSAALNRIHQVCIFTYFYVLFPMQLATRSSTDRVEKLTVRCEWLKL